MYTNQIVTVFGGSGFIGRTIVADLARAGFIVRIATRTPQSCYAMKTLGNPGQIVPQFYHPGRPETIAAVVNGSFAVINAVGILFERRRSTFHAAHIELARAIATACKRYQVSRFIHFSGLGIEHSKSKYAKTKLQGEQIVRDTFSACAIVRPSVVFGPDDQFFNLFARLAAWAPGLPLIGGGKTRFQPVYVGDVAAAVFNLVVGDSSLQGKTYELGGPETLDFSAIYQRMFLYTGQKRLLINLPFSIARLQARFLQMMPHPLLTVDQVRSLETDSVVSEGALGLVDLGVMPTALDTVLPTYLSRYRAGGTFAEVKRA